MVAAVVGQAFDSWSVAKAVLAVFVVPAAVLAIGLPAAAAIVLVGIVRSRSIDEDRRGLRPVVVAASTVGVLVL